MSASKSKYPTFTLYRRLIMQARPYWLHVGVFLLLNLAETPLALLAPLPLKIAVDSLIGGRAFPSALGWVESPGQSATTTILIVCSLVVVFTLLTLVQKLTTALLKSYVSEKLVLSFRSRMFRHVQHLSLSYHDTNGTSDTSYRIQYDAPAIQTVVVESIIPLISAVVMLGSMIFVTAKISPQLALIAVGVTPVLLILTAGFRNVLRRQWREAKKLESSAQSVVSEVLGALRVVKAFTREEHEHARFVRSSQTGMAARLRVAFQENFYALLVGMTTAIGTASVLFVGVRSVQAGVLSLGSLLMVMAYLGKLYDPLKTIGKQLATKQKALVSAERAFALLDEKLDVPERPNARPLKRSEGAITFNNVSFGYSGNPSVLRDVSFEIPAGKCVGVTGRTGAGKTTLVNLLGRFYDPNSGQISLDGVDLRDFKIADLRNQFTVVLQEPVLFSASIEENIAYGRPDAPHEEIVRAAKAANAHEFIEQCPDGYQTQVGERGMCLSGGERQRISLARAFLRDAPILVLDEPTSSVDTKTEGIIMEAMERLMAGRTAFMIAHRLSTLDKCNLRLNVDGGRVTVTQADEAVSLLRPDADDLPEPVATAPSL